MAKCLACGSENLVFWGRAKDSEYHSVPDAFSFNLCLDCHSLSIDPVPETRLAEIYPPNYYSFAEGAPSLLGRLKQTLDQRLFKRIFGDIQGTDLAALDVGGGSGWLLSQARQVEPRLSKTMVVDIDQQAESRARSAGHDYFCGRIEDYESATQYDLILMLNLIEHVKDPCETLRAMGRLLKPGGKVLIKTPNHDSLDARIFRRGYWGGLHCPRHWVLFTPESFRGLAERAGLSVTEVKMTQGAPFWSNSVLHLLNRVGLINVTAEKPMHRHFLAPALLAAFAMFDFLRTPVMRTSQMFVILGLPDK